MDKELEVAKQNSHEPGFIFGGIHGLLPVCFCKKCNLALTYYDGHVIDGAWRDKCNE